MASAVGSSTIQLFNARNMRNLPRPDFEALRCFASAHRVGCRYSTKIRPSLPERLRPRLDGGLRRDPLEPLKLVARPCSSSHCL